MTSPITAISMFCDDIREEKRGTDTVVGIFPDNLSVLKLPGALARLSLYTRIHLDPELDPGPLSLLLRLPDGVEVPLGQVDPEMVSRSRTEARDAGASFAGLIVRAMMNNVGISQAGRINAVLKAGADEYVTASLNVKLSPSVAASEPSL